MAHLQNALSIDGTTLYLQSWTTQHAMGNVFLVHGYSEHSGRYKQVADDFNNAGFNVFTYDQRGSGRSEGERAYIPDFNQVISDLEAVLDYTSMPALPTFILGHSLGGLIVAKYFIHCTEDKFNGAILSAPSIKIDDSISPFLRKLSGFLGRVLPHLKTIKLVTDHLSRDKTVVSKYMRDPLVYHGGTKARTGLCILETMQDIKSQLEDIRIPILILHGTEDKITDPSGSQMLYDGISSDDKSIKFFEELYHEIMNEPERDLVIEEMVNWLRKRC